MASGCYDTEEVSSASATILRKRHCFVSIATLSIIILMTGTYVGLKTHF
jgi:hypothetical protein